VTKNAFDILMSSARTPGAFEMPMMNPSAMDKSIRHGFSVEQWERIEENCDSIVNLLKRRIYDTIPEQDEDEINCAYFRQTPTFVNATISPGEAFPPPDTVEPRPGALLKHLTAHFRRIPQPGGDSYKYSDDDSYEDADTSESESESDANLRVSGVVLGYSDGCEVEIGLVEGSAKTVTVHLEEGEHITHVSQHADNLGVVGMRFYTAEPGDREFILANGKMFGEFHDEYEWVYCKWISLDMPFGTILRSFEWCHEKRRIVRAIFQEKPIKALMTSLARAATKAIPDAAKKDFEGLQDKVRNDHIRNVESGIAYVACGSLFAFYLKDRAEALLEEFHLYEASQWNHGNSRASWPRRAELATNHLSRIRSILLVTTDVECRALERKCDRLITCAQQRVLQAKEKLKSKAMSEWKELHQKHASQLGRLVLHGVSRPGSTCLCPYCFGTFSPMQVRILQRCSKEGCFDCIPNCGCSISPCNRCHIPYCCLSHLAQHEQECVALASSKCGWSAKRATLDPEFCRQASSTGELCHCSICNTQCCEACRVECVGRPRKPNWKEIWVEEDPWSEAARRKRAKRKRMSCSFVWCISCSKVASYSVRTWQCCDDCDCAESSSDDDDDASDSDYTPES